MRKNKTLESVLKNLNCNIKVGSKQGSSFFYCGTIGGLYHDLDKVEQTLNAYNNGLIKALEQRLKSINSIYKERFENWVDRCNKTKIYLTEQDKEKEWAKLTELKEKEKLSIPRKIEAIRKHLNKPLLERNVLEMVDGISVDEKPCKIIYVSGHEKGAYWTINEYAKVKNKRLPKCNYGKELLDYGN